MCDHHVPTSASAECCTATAEHPSDHPLLDTLTMSERKIHRTCLKAHLLGNAARLRFIRALRAAAETRLYIKLGYPTVHQYAKDQFQCENTQAHEFLRVGKLLHKLPLMTREYEMGRLSWSAFEVMSRVPKVQGKERQWIEFARGKSMAQIKDEVHRAIEENRSAPRKDGYSLRNRLVRLIFELTLEEHDKLLKAFLKLARELEPSLRGRRLQPKELLMYLIERILETDPAGTPRGRVEREESLYNFLYHLCRACGAKHLITPDGPVEVPQEVIDRVKGSAHTVEIPPDEEWEVIVDDVLTPIIDNPNTAALARKVVLRDGACCANCKRKLALHAHHIRFRARGGRTVLANETAVCVRCHSLLHLGLLKISGNPIDGITFHTRAEEMTEEFLKEAEEEVTAVPVLIVSPAKEAEAEGPSGRPEGTDRVATTEDQAARPVAAEDSGRPESGVSAGEDAGAQAGGGAQEVPTAAPKAGSRSGRPEEENEAVEMTEAALRTLGFRAREASEAAQRARESLLRQGRAALTIADSSDLLREAFRPRWLKGGNPPPPQRNTNTTLGS